MATRKRPYRRDVDQVQTVHVTTAQIMLSAAFRRGFEDARKGVAFDWRVGGADVNAAWNYERGRLLAHIAPLNMPLMINGWPNPKAITLFDAASKRRLVT